MLATSRSDLQTYRCYNCRTILGKMALAPGSVVEIKCKCNVFNMIQVVDSSSKFVTCGHVGVMNVFSLTT